MIEHRNNLDGISNSSTNSRGTDWRLKLNLNENIYGCSNLAFSALKNLDINEISFNPDMEKFISKVAKYYNIRNENLFIANGSKQASKIVFDTFLNACDEIVSYNPILPEFENCFKNIGVKLKLVEYDEKFIFKTDKLSQNITPKTKMVYISTPDRLTGSIVKRAHIEELLKRHNEVLFVVDCSFVNFSLSFSLMDYIDLVNVYDNIIVIKSCSYDYGLSALKTAHIFSNAEKINLIQENSFGYEPNLASLRCMVNALNDNKFLENVIEENIKAKNMLASGIEESGYKVYPSEANFILADFGDYCDFYYEKLKKNGVLVYRFSKESTLSSCFRITVPKIGGVKYILELLNKKDVLIFDVDDVIIDISNSYTEAIKRTVKYFLNKEISFEEIQKIKNISSTDLSWNIVQIILKEHGLNVEISDVINIFQKILLTPDNDGKKLIDEDKLLITQNDIKELSNKFDLVIFSNRLKQEIIYSFEKLGINEYFYYYMTCDDLPRYLLKPNPKGLFEILKACPYKKIKFVANGTDDIIAGNGANVEIIGVVNSYCDYNSAVNNFRHLGVKYILEDIKRINDFANNLNENKMNKI